MPPLLVSMIRFSVAASRVLRGCELAWEDHTYDLAPLRAQRDDIVVSTKLNAWSSQRVQLRLAVCRTTNEDDAIGCTQAPAVVYFDNNCWALGSIYKQTIEPLRDHLKAGSHATTHVESMAGPDGVRLQYIGGVQCRADGDERAAITYEVRCDTTAAHVRVLHANQTSTCAWLVVLAAVAACPRSSRYESSAFETDQAEARAIVMRLAALGSLNSLPAPVWPLWMQVGGRDDEENQGTPNAVGVMPLWRRTNARVSDGANGGRVAGPELFSDLRPLQRSDIELSKVVQLCCGLVAGIALRVRLAVGRELVEPCSGTSGVATLTLLVTRSPPPCPSPARHVNNSSRGGGSSCGGGSGVRSLALLQEPRPPPPHGAAKLAGRVVKGAHGMSQRGGSTGGSTTAEGLVGTGGGLRGGVAVDGSLCSSLGSLERQSVVTKPWGVTLLYSGGAFCAPDGRMASVAYHLLCSPTEKAAARLLNVTNDTGGACGWVAWLVSPYACPLMPADFDTGIGMMTTYWDDAFGAAAALGLPSDIIDSALRARAAATAARAFGMERVGGGTCVPGGTRPCHCGGHGEESLGPRTAGLATEPESMEAMEAMEAEEVFNGAQSAEAFSGAGASDCILALDGVHWSSCRCQVDAQVELRMIHWYLAKLVWHLMAGGILGALLGAVIVLAAVRAAHAQPWQRGEATRQARRRRLALTACP